MRDGRRHTVLVVLENASPQVNLVDLLKSVEEVLGIDRTVLAEVGRDRLADLSISIGRKCQLLLYGRHASILRVELHALENLCNGAHKNRVDVCQQLA